MQLDKFIALSNLKHLSLYYEAAITGQEGYEKQIENFAANRFFLSIYSFEIVVY